MYSIIAKSLVQPSTLKRNHFFLKIISKFPKISSLIIPSLFDKLLVINVKFRKIIVIISKQTLFLNNIISFFVEKRKLLQPP